MLANHLSSSSMSILGIWQTSRTHWETIRHWRNDNRGSSQAPCPQLGPTPKLPQRYHINVSPFSRETCLASSAQRFGAWVVVDLAALALAVSR
jgi:hypothetical protein